MKITAFDTYFQTARAIVISRSRNAVFLLIFIFSIAPSAVFGKPLAEYRENVENAKITIEDLIYADAEEMSPAEFKIYERDALAELRANLPPSERIEWQNSTTDIDNRWLHNGLDELKSNEAANSSKRETILTEIGERLGALERKLVEMENASPDARVKDEDKQKLAEILRREEYQKPEEQRESFFQRMWKKLMDWLDDSLPNSDIPAPAAEGFQSLSLVLQILLYALVLGAIGFLIYRFAPVLAEKFTRRERGEKSDRVILGERIAANETAENLFAEAERLARSGDMRGAIRKGYVALLCDLSDRKIIGLARHKTNRDYLRDVRPKRDLHENMRGLTVKFERHWYGFDAVEEKDWEEFRNGYKEVVSL